MVFGFGKKKHKAFKLTIKTPRGSRETAIRTFSKKPQVGKSTPFGKVVKVESATKKQLEKRKSKIKKQFLKSI